MARVKRRAGGEAVTTMRGKAASSMRAKRRPQWRVGWERICRSEVKPRAEPRSIISVTGVAAIMRMRKSEGSWRWRAKVAMRMRMPKKLMVMRRADQGDLARRVRRRTQMLRGAETAVARVVEVAAKASGGPRVERMAFTSSAVGSVSPVRARSSSRTWSSRSRTMPVQRGAADVGVEEGGVDEVEVGVDGFAGFEGHGGSPVLVVRVRDSCDQDRVSQK